MADNASRDPNDLLADARRRLLSPTGSGRVMSRQELADAVNAYLWERYRVVEKVDATYVGHLEQGRHRWPNARRREAFRHVLGVTSDSDVGFYINRSEYRAMRDGSDRGTTSQLAGRPLHTPGAPTVDMDEVLAHLIDQWHVQVRADNLLGPRHALTTVGSQLQLLQRLLAGNLGEWRTSVVRLAAQYAESAAWLYEDSGDLTKAQQWTSRSMEWAYETGDHGMLAWAAYRRSQQLAEQRRLRESLGLILSCRRDEGRLTQMMRVAIQVQHARALAAVNEAPTALKLLDEARTCSANDDQGDARKGHGSFCTDGYIEVQRAVCLSAVGRFSDAIQVFERAVPLLPAVYRRDRASALVSKAAAHVAFDQPEEAATTAREALPIASAAGSLRIVRHVTAVATRLRPHRHLEPVAALLNDLTRVAA